MDGQLSTGKTWHMLRFLLDHDNNKKNHMQAINKLIHAYEGTEEEFLNELQQKYLTQAPPCIYPSYNGNTNAKLDEELTEAEIRAALQKLNTKSAPGPDGITNKTLRNLDDESIAKLTEYINECWVKGEVPAQWKKATITLIPKPGKKLEIDNLRPISLTSCVGKLMEHVILNRVDNFLEDNTIYPDTMIGFRKNLSTQDAMLQLKHQIIDYNTRSTRAILGLDLKKAFDNANHATILENIERIGLGQRTYNYIKSFLSDRKAVISVGGSSRPRST